MELIIEETPPKQGLNPFTDLYPQNLTIGKNPKRVSFAPSNILNGTPNGVPLDVKGQLLPIPKGDASLEACPISNLRRCRMESRNKNEKQNTTSSDFFNNIKLPTFTKPPLQPQPLQQPQQPYPNKYHPREPFKQPSYHQKYQQVEKTKSQEQTLRQIPRQSQNIIQPAFSYDHILQSLHMKVNDGKLEYIAPTPKNNLEKTKNKIINHYFQNHPQQPQQLQPPPPSITREEYQRRIAYHFWKKQEERKRIAQIKSKKMLYPTDNIQISRTKFTSLPFG